MKPVRSWVLFLAVWMGGPSAACAASLVGTWFGTGQPGDKAAMYIDRMLANGEIHSSFRVCRNGKPQDDTEDGYWSVASGILTISVTSHNGQFMPRVDTYKIVSVGDRTYSEIYLRLNFPYQSRRVDAKFQMPSCQFIS